MSRYEMRFDAARKLLANTTDPIVSLKIRPTDDQSTMINYASDCYFYGDEYNDASAAFKTMNFISTWESSDCATFAGKARVYKSPSGQSFLFVEHETGPEFIFIVHTFGGFLTAHKDPLEAAAAIVSIAKDIAPGVKRLLEILSNSVRRKRLGESVERAHDAQYVKLEERTQRRESVVVNLALPLQKELSDAEVEDYIARLTGDFA